MEENSNSDRYLFTLLGDSINAGYMTDFGIDVKGNIFCINTQKRYALNELILKPITCGGSYATLYLIRTCDGILGTLVDFWEH